VRQNLPEYCGLDTMAMVRLVEGMKEAVNSEWLMKYTGTMYVNRQIDFLVRRSIVLG